MKKESIETCKILGTASLFAVTMLGSSLAQTTGPSAPPPTAMSTQSNQASPNAGTNAPTATGQAPLEGQSKEGFWGHMNPFARKKWVARQVDPIRDRTNELDELEAKNANDIRDVDTRATAGINKAMVTANAADQHAADAAQRADQANSTAVTANSRTNALNGTVSTLDQYQPVTSTTIAFVGGRTMLNSKAKANLDDFASSISSQKGYIIEVQGYSRAGVQSSEAMADSVVRYLVEAHQVPIYRIYRTGLGRATPQNSMSATPAENTTATTATPEKPITNGVRVTVLHNSLASMDDQQGQSGNSSPTPVPQGGEQ